MTVESAVGAPPQPAGSGSTVREWLRRPVIAGVALLVLYLALSLFNDPRAYLGTDTGGKVATLEAMQESGRLDPDVGYWAEQWDPDGDVHPYWYTSRFGDKWVQLSTVPMTYAALPLYELGGYRAALLLPMLGSVAAAFAARAIARRVADDRAGWMAFWLVGAASPMVLYALDFWEHSLGVALIAWGMVPLIDILRERDGPRGALVTRSALAGLAFGAAATMRTEALVYLVVALGVVGIVLLWERRSLLAPLLVGVTTVVATGVPLVLNAVLETATLGDTMRAGRNVAVAQAPAAGGDQVVRLKEALITSGSLFPSLDPNAYLLSIALIALLAFVAVKASRRGDQSPAKLAAAAIVFLYVIRFAQGPGFVPGLAAATPVACVGLALAWRKRVDRVVVLVAIAGLPLVWLFQYTGGAAPQWAGRYMLPTGLLLAALGAAYLVGMQQWARRFFIGLAIAVTAFGVLWMSIRTHQMADAQEALAARPEPVLVSTVAHLAREGGYFGGDHRWLTAIDDDARDQAAGVVEAAGYDEFGLVRLAEDVPDGAEAEVGTPIGDFEPVATSRVALFDGTDLEVVTYRRIGV